MEDLVSIIIPIYNSEKYLEKCMNSVINQSYINIEIILINDGSNDNSEIICKKYVLKDERIKYIPKENGGVSSARNLGICNANGKYIFFLDSDDYIDRDVISNLIKNTKENKLCSVFRKNVYKDRFTIGYYSKSNFNIDEFIMGVINGKIGGYSCGYLFDSKIIKDIQYDVNTSYMEDTLLLIKYIKIAGIDKICFIDGQNYYNYNYSENSITSNKKNIMEKLNNVFYSLDKIDSYTEKKYSNAISNKKIRILESQLRLINSKEELAKIINNISIPKYTYNEPRYKIFVHLYNSKKVSFVYNYYRIRNIIKRIFKKRI